MQRTAFYRNASLALLLTLAACKVGPEYVHPEAVSSAAPPFLGSTTPAVTSTEGPDGTWWRLYQDPVLDELVADALAANKDIAVATANLDRARAALRAVRGDRLPSLSLDAQGGYQRSAASQTLPGSSRSGSTVDGGFSVAYEVDLFGRISRGIEAARGDVAAADADRDAVRVAIVAETARAYADLGSLAERIRVAKRTVELVDQSVQITAKRFEAGRANRLDTSRAATLRDQVRATVPPLEAEREAALFSLATLTGRTPRDLPPEIGASAAVLHLDRPLPVGDGRALLARRPRCPRRRAPASRRDRAHRRRHRRPLPDDLARRFGRLDERRPRQRPDRRRAALLYRRSAVVEFPQPGAGPCPHRRRPRRDCRRTGAVR